MVFFNLLSFGLIGDPALDNQQDAPKKANAVEEAANSGCNKLPVNRQVVFVLGTLLLAKQPSEPVHVLVPVPGVKTVHGNGSVASSRPG